MTYVNSCKVLGLMTMSLLPALAQHQEARRITLTEAVHLALGQNRALKISRLKVMENQHKKNGERSAYLPSITNQSSALYSTDLQDIGIPAGAFGSAGGGLVPSHNVTIPQGNSTLFSTGTTVAQPLTQLLRIRQSNRVAAAEVAISLDGVKKAENQIALQVHNLYFGILVARLQKLAAEQQSGYAAEHLRESEEDVRNGSALKVTAIESTAGVLQSRQAILSADLQLSDLSTELNDLLGLPLDTRLELDPAVPVSFAERPREEYLYVAWQENPEIAAAEDAVRKAKAGVAAARTAFIPDVTAVARQSYQNGVPFLVHNFGMFGVNVNWDVFDFGKRRSAVRERETQLTQAEENLLRLKDEVAVNIERSYNRVERTRSLVEVANQVVKLRQESERLAQNQLSQGVVLVSERRQATAASYKAQADFLHAKLGYLLACAELEQTVGHTPGF